MTARGIAVDVLLALAVAIVLASSVGLLVMRDVYQKDALPDARRARGPGRGRAWRSWSQSG